MNRINQIAQNPLNRGQSIIEVIVALVITGLVAVGIVRISSSAVKNVRYSTEQTQATNLAGKIIADNRELKDSQPDVFWGLLDTTSSGHLDNYCYLTEISDARSQVQLIIPTESPSYLTAKMAQVKVTVFWELIDENNGCNPFSEGRKHYRHQVEVTTLISN